MKRELIEVKKFKFEDSTVKRIRWKKPFNQNQCKTCSYLSDSGLVCMVSSQTHSKNGRCRDKIEKEFVE